MSGLRERAIPANRQMPGEAILAEPSPGQARTSTLLRATGAIAVLVVGAVHLEQYFAVHFNVVPIIGPLFLLNFIGATSIGVGLLVPVARMHLLHALLALGGIGLATMSFVFLFISEHQALFGFEDYGYRAAIIVALAAEAAAAVLLSGYLATRRRS
jgi:hypothetical protein